ncbi:MAG TPA: sodium:solute symporter family protein [Clostridia bacterium]|jgi:Na+/proline symporter|nr:sodium:solute symporter family protein [Clostridia bacterium]
MSPILLSTVTRNPKDVWQAYLVLFVYIALIVAIALFSRKKAKTLDGFLLGNRSVGGWLSAFGYGTTYFSAVVFVGYAGTFGMNIGLAGVWIGIANAAFGSLLAWLVLAKKTREYTNKVNAQTMPQFFEKRYSSYGLKIFSAVIIFILLIPYSTSVYQGIGYIFEAVFGLKFEYCVIIMAIVTALYVFLGGYLGNAISNFVQGIIMLGGIVLIIALMLASKTVNGIEGLRTLTEMGYGFFPKSDPTKYFFDRPVVVLITNILLTSFGVWAVPQSVQKFYAIKDDKAIMQGTVISTFFALIVGGGAYFNGGFSRLFYPEMPTDGTSHVIPDMFMRNEYMGYAVLGLICVLVLAASMSTLSSLALVSSSSVGVDMYKGVIKRDASDKSVRNLVSVFSVLFVMLSAVLAILRVEAIVTLMSLSWGTISGCFIGPYIYGLYTKKASRVGAYISMITTLVITVVLIFVFGAVGGGNGFSELISLGIKRAPVIGVICMMASMLVTPIGFFFKDKGKEEEKIVPYDETIRESMEEIEASSGVHDIQTEEVAK